MAKKKSVTLQTLFQAKQKSMLTELKAIRAGVYHAPTMGSASQKRWRDLFRDYLPNRYQIDEAHVIDCKGKQSEQIDLVIYDRQYANLAINQDGVLYVPAESVYAVCEIKQNVTKGHIDYTGKKVESVRKLERTSSAILQMDGRTVRKTPKQIIGCLIAVESDYSPAFGATFLKNLKALKNDKKIDLIFTLDNGLYDGDLEASLGLVEFMYKLMSRLQEMGNAPAIDLNAYLRNLKPKK